MQKIVSTNTTQHYIFISNKNYFIHKQANFTQGLSTFMMPALS